MKRLLRLEQSLSVLVNGPLQLIRACVCLHEHITCACQLRCADAHLMTDYRRGWEQARDSAVCVCVSVL